MTFFETWFMLIILPKLQVYTLGIFTLVCFMYIILGGMYLVNETEKINYVIKHIYFKFVTIIGIVCMLLALILPANKIDVALMYIVPEITANKNISEKSLQILDNIIKNIIVFEKTQSK